MKRSTTDTQRQQNLVRGVLNFCIFMASLSVLILILVGFACGPHLTPRSLQRWYYKFRNYYYGRGWSWNPLESVTPTPDGYSVSEVRRGLPASLRVDLRRLASEQDINLIKRAPRGLKSHECMADASSNENAYPVVKADTETYAMRNQKGFCDTTYGMWSTDKYAPILVYKYDVIAQIMGLRHGYRVLDLGAGCGHSLDLLAGRYGFEAVAVDLEPSNVQWAHKNLHQLDTFCCADGTRLPFPNNSFDAVLSNAALRHVKSQVAQCQILKGEVLRVLRPGGCAWFGWMGGGHEAHANGNYSSSFLRDGNCKLDQSQKLYAFRELELFGISEYRDPNATSVFVCKADPSRPHSTNDSDEGQDSISSSFLGLANDADAMHYIPSAGEHVTRRLVRASQASDLDVDGARQGRTVQALATGLSYKKT